MVHYYKNKYNNSYRNTVLGGNLKTEEEKDKAKNVTVVKKLPEEDEPIKIKRQNATVEKIQHKKISDEKLKRFINFKI
jgi:hypothetical protein